MKKTNQSSNYSRLNERLGIGFGISVIAIIVLLIALLTTITKPIKASYLINFYEGDELITTEKLLEGEVISEKRLEEIALSRIDDSYEYKYMWSLRKDSYLQVNFDYLNKNTDVYLIKYIDEFSINVQENSMFNYEILTDGPIINGSSVTIKIEQLVDPEQYHMNVYANNQLIAPNDDGNYLIENIKENVDIYVKYLEKLYITPILYEPYVYNTSVHDVGYNVTNYKGEEVDISDILIRYYNSQGEYIDKLIDAGEYEVHYSYSGNEYYIEPVIEKLNIDKASPYASVDDKYVYYDSSPQGFDILDIDTNSDGLIEFINNTNTDVGSYLVEIKIKESANYYGITLEAYLNILKAKPNISENPIADVGFEGHTLDDVGFIDGITNAEGTFKWSEPSTVLDVGEHEYEMVFIPTDPNNYEQITLLVKVKVLSQEEQLRHISTVRSTLENDDSVLFGNMLNTYYLGADIMWMSLSSVAMVDSGGYITVIGSPGTYTVDIIGIMMFGDTAEYVTITLNIVIDTGGGIQLTRL